ncbi:unnamed protein product [Ceratitis capitata]|uniref:(Mediterranean fruit fly) hypothetical protein n=1 Tax=Ceratitis capitata TaxID=7213 RepID=A0A811U2X1_CERCA|nr:unnamed protein product [Ceratitis capitata]
MCEPLGDVENVSVVMCVYVRVKSTGKVSNILLVLRFRFSCHSKACQFPLILYYAFLASTAALSAECKRHFCTQRSVSRQIYKQSSNFITRDEQTEEYEIVEKISFFKY